MSITDIMLLADAYADAMHDHCSSAAKIESARAELVKALKAAFRTNDPEKKQGD